MTAARTPRTQLDRHVDQVVDALLAGDQPAARQAFGDAQAFMADLTALHDSALVWVDAEQRLVQRLPATVEQLDDAKAAARLERLRREPTP